MAAAFNALGNLRQALAAAEAAQQHANTAADRAAAARLAAAIAKEQQRQQQQEQLKPGACPSKGTASFCAAGASVFSSASTTANDCTQSGGAASAAFSGRNDLKAANDPVEQLLQQFVAATCTGSSAKGRAGAPLALMQASAKPAKQRAGQGMGSYPDIKTPAAATAEAAGDPDVTGSIKTLKLPNQSPAQQHQQQRRKVLVEVLASSECDEIGLADAEWETVECISSSTQCDGRADQGFLIREVQVTKGGGSRLTTAEVAATGELDARSVSTPQI